MIENYTFGSLMIDGKEYGYDVKIVNGNVIPWSPTKHHTVTLKDLKELLEAEPELIIIGTGAYGAVRVPEDVKRHLEAEKVKFIILNTEEACEEVNRAHGKKVCALIHSTC